MTANAGYHAYATGDVLTAAQVQYNLQNQSVMYFATSAARTTAIGSVTVEGMVTYIPANGLEYYNGTAWVVLSTGGDITGVTAGKGLTGGGTSGDVTVSLGTAAKGDLVAGTGTTTAAALTVGANDYFLQAASGATTGLQWGGTWTAYTPVATAQTGTITSYVSSGIFMKLGKMVFFRATVNITNKGTGSDYLKITLPSTASGNSAVYGIEPAVTGKSVSGNIFYTDADKANVRYYDFTTCIATNVTVIINGFYEVA